MKSFFFAFLTTATVLASKDDHAGHSETCACAAKELDFNIDCTQGDLLLTTLAALVAEDCATKCSSESCRKNFLIVQTHHDFCLHMEVPEPVEDAFHDYEGICEECEIVRRRNFELSDCPTAICDGRGNTAYQVLLTSGCLTNCMSSVCGTNYQILRTEHDNCDHDSLSESAETGIHDFEEICEPFNCNSLLEDKSVNEQLICTEEEKKESNAVASQVSGFLIAFSGVALLANY
eukprot:CAMPEP_0198251970 /NCGR_PEP_ID=MMETSP1447-20131203/2621_1 /TAXON_ID=420782 /ORGANISM="Chaetoceros dichaeta, Strain CCMP1751" /LENGTH=233 /DNA_ID=CAMNT_0043937107 /DNA_START=129 /DNA_END=830 /DNA_ORIENTATION=-